MSEFKFDRKLVQKTCLELGMAFTVCQFIAALFRPVSPIYVYLYAGGTLFVCLVMGIVINNIMDMPETKYAVSFLTAQLLIVGFLITIHFEKPHGDASEKWIFIAFMDFVLAAGIVSKWCELNGYELEIGDQQKLGMFCCVCSHLVIDLTIAVCSAAVLIGWVKTASIMLVSATLCHTVCLVIEAIDLKAEKPYIITKTFGIIVYLFTATWAHSILFKTDKPTEQYGPLYSIVFITTFLLSLNSCHILFETWSSDLISIKKKNE